MIHLKAIKDGNAISTGDYQCSECGERFRPNPANPGEMHQTFAEHVALTHAQKKTAREDFNQTAARIAREATGG